MAEYRLQNLSCGSCVGKIEAALASVDGVGRVDIDLTSNRGRILFDPARIDSQSIADTISAAGYPAQLHEELSADQYLSLSREQEQLGQRYLARIGDRLLSRSDFNILLEQRSAGTSDEQRTVQRRALWNEVLQRELMLNAASANGIVVQDGEVDARIAELNQQHPGFEQVIAQRYPDHQLFREQMREEMVIERNLERHVFAGTASQQQKQRLFQEWFNDLQNNTEVVIFDPEIKALSRGGSGCGGGCCG